MAVVSFEKAYIESLLGKPLSKAEMEERIPMLGCPFEGEENGKISFEIFPNRPDMLSAEGFARALQAFFGLKTGLKEYYTTKPTVNITVSRAVQNVRPFIAAAVIREARMAGPAVESLIQLQEKIDETMGRKRKKIAIGIHDMDKVRPPFTYTAVGPKGISFVPLDGKEKMTPQEILSKHPKGKLYGHILAGSNMYPVIHDHDGQVLSLPPIINGELTRVTERTKSIFIDVTGPQKKPLHEALNIIVTSLADGGMKIEAVNIGGKRCPDLSPRKLEVNPGHINSLLGTKLSEKEIAALASRMGFGYDGGVLVPPYRTDIMHEMDIAEDIAIAYGYENFMPAQPSAPGIATRLLDAEFHIFCGRLMVGLGFQEIQSMYLTNMDELSKTRIQATDTCRISNAVSTECTLCRPSLLPGVLKAFSQNRHNPYPHKVFEIGEVFVLDRLSETGASNPMRLAAGISDTAAGYEKLATVLDSFISNVGADFSLRPCTRQGFINGRTASVLSGNAEIGVIGEIHPSVLHEWSLEKPVVAFEIGLDKIFRGLSRSPP